MQLNMNFNRNESVMKSMQGNLFTPKLMRVMLKSFEKHKKTENSKVRCLQAVTLSARGFIFILFFSEAAAVTLLAATGEA